MSTTTLHNMVAILQLTGQLRYMYAALVYSDLILLWSIDTCENKISADQYPVTTLQAQA